MPEALLQTFPRLLLHQAKVRPDRPAVREKDLGIWQTWTWAQALEEVRSLACGLAAQGFKRGDRLAVVGDNRPRLYWAMMAAQALGVPRSRSRSARSGSPFCSRDDGGAGSAPRSAVWLSGSRSR